MKTLYLIRHAKSSWDNPGLGDFERPLNQRGERDVERMGGYLQIHHPPPQKIVCSPARRTVLTAAGLGKIWGFPEKDILYEKEVYLASPEELARICRKHFHQTPFERLALIGHNPGISLLSNQLSSQSAGDMPTLGIAVFSFKSEIDFSALKPSDHHTVITPKGIE